jgi:hypothetical protein
VTATQVLVHPIKTGTGAVKFLLVRSFRPAPPPLAEAATQKAPVRLEVRRFTRKKDSADGTPIVFGSPGYSSYREAASLRITLQNLSPQPLTNVTVRWAIAKIPVGRNPMMREAFFGMHETVALKAMEEKQIETGSIEVGGVTSTQIGRSSGEMIRGHGVQVLIGTNLVAEELVPPTIKIPFKNLQPVPKPQ